MAPPAKVEGKERRRVKCVRRKKASKKKKERKE